MNDFSFCLSNVKMAARFHRLRPIYQRIRKFWQQNSSLRLPELTQFRKDVDLNFVESFEALKVKIMFQVIPTYGFTCKEQSNVNFAFEVIRKVAV